MGQKSSVQTIVMHHLGSKYGQIRVKKRSFLLKKCQIDFFFVYLNSTHDDDFKQISLKFLVQRKTQVVVDLLK